MNADRSRPLVAYGLVALACAAVIAQGLRTGAVGDLVGVAAPEVTAALNPIGVRGTVLSARAPAASDASAAPTEQAPSRPDTVAPGSPTTKAEPAVYTQSTVRPAVHHASKPRASVAHPAATHSSVAHPSVAPSSSQEPPVAKPGATVKGHGQAKHEHTAKHQLQTAKAARPQTHGKAKGRA